MFGKLADTINIHMNIKYTQTHIQTYTQRYIVFTKVNKPKIYVRYVDDIIILTETRRKSKI